MRSMTPSLLGSLLELKPPENVLSLLADEADQNSQCLKHLFCSSGGEGEGLQEGEAEGEEAPGGGGRGL